MQDDAQHPGQPGNAQYPMEERQHALVAAAQPAQVLALQRPDDERTSSENEINLRQYWEILLKQKWPILVILGIVFFTELVVTLLTTPTYRATTTIQIDRDTAKIVEVQGVNSNVDSAFDDTFYNTQYALLRSPALSQRVASQLHLANDPTFKHLQDAYPFSKLKATLVPGKKRDR